VTTGVVVVDAELRLLVLMEVLVALLVLLVLLLVLLLLDVVDTIAEVGTWLLGRHCEYHGFWATQVLPEAQQVAPLQPLPPHWLLHIPVSAEAPSPYLEQDLPDGAAVLALLNNRGSQGGGRKGGGEKEFRSHCGSQTDVL